MATRRAKVRRGAVALRGPEARKEVPLHAARHAHARVRTTAEERPEHRARAARRAAKTRVDVLRRNAQKARRAVLLFELRSLPIGNEPRRDALRPPAAARAERVRRDRRSAVARLIARTGIHSSPRIPARDARLPLATRAPLELRRLLAHHRDAVRETPALALPRERLTRLRNEPPARSHEVIGHTKTSVARGQHRALAGLDERRGETSRPRARARRKRSGIEHRRTDVRTHQRRCIRSAVALNDTSVRPARARRRLARARRLPRSRIDARRATLVLCARRARQDIEAHLHHRNAHAHARPRDPAHRLTARRSIAVASTHDGLGHTISARARLQPRAVLRAHDRARHTPRAPHQAAPREQRRVDPRFGCASPASVRARSKRLHSRVGSRELVERAVFARDGLHDTTDRPERPEDAREHRSKTPGRSIDAHGDPVSVHIRGQRAKRTDVCGTALSTGLAR